MSRPKPRIDQLKPTRPGQALKRITLYSHIYPAPFGPLYVLVTREGSVVRTGFSADTFTVDESKYAVEENKYACGEVAYQLEQYFQERRQFFDLDLVFWEGTEFQQDVWKRMMRIEFGSTTSYGEIAQKVGRRHAARAVGNAVGRNPLPILIPCHRVLPQSGGIGSYCTQYLDREAGKGIKRYLLELEARAPVLA